MTLADTSPLTVHGSEVPLQRYFWALSPLRSGFSPEELICIPAVGRLCRGKVPSRLQSRWCFLPLYQEDVYFHGWLRPRTQSHGETKSKGMTGEGEVALVCVVTSGRPLNIRIYLDKDNHGEELTECARNN